MGRIARSVQPLYQTRGRPISWPIRLTNPDGSALILAGATIAVVLHARGADLPLTVTPLARDGAVLVTGGAAQASLLAAGNLNELKLTLTDSRGTPFDFVWPVIGEDL